MPDLQKSIEALCRELEAERVENAKFRRMMEDILYNLEDENMPSVAARLVKGERSIGLLVEDGQVRGSVLVEAINGASAVAIDADKIDMNGTVLVSRINNSSAVAIDADKIDMNGTVLVSRINNSSAVAIDADKIDMNGTVLVSRINNSSAVTINADKIDLDGNLLVERINGASAVTIAADKIDLNGAVTANGNFKINEDGSASCAALTVTGGRISLPDPEDGSAVLAVHTADAAGGVTVYADRIAFAGEFVPGWQQEASLSLSQLALSSEVDQGNGTVQRTDGYYRPGEISLLWQDTTNGTAGDLDKLQITPRYITMPYIAAHPVAKTAGMRPVYLDADGSLYAVIE